MREGALTRYGWPEEVGRAMEFSVTPDSSHIAGQVLRIDGGGQLFRPDRQRSASESKTSPHCSRLRAPAQRVWSNQSSGNRVWRS